MTTDVTDATFRDEVLTASDEVPVVVDLWAPWCGPCRILGPILEKAIDATNGAIKLAKINIDENPKAANTFAVQSIPAVFAIYGGQIVDRFVGVLPERDVRDFIERLVPHKTEADLLAEKGDEASLRQAVALEPDHDAAILALVAILTQRARPEDRAEALSLLARLPETAEVRRAAAQARLAVPGSGATPTATATAATAGAEAAVDTVLEARLDDLLERAKDEPDARQELLDFLETMEVDDPRRKKYRKALAAKLF